MKELGSNITITDSVINKMQILPLGNCEQDGTPTPDYPQDIKVVTGDNQVVVENKNLVTGKVANVYIALNGSFSTDTNFDVYYAKIVEGETYTIKTDEQNLLVYGFYENKPILTSKTYDNTRHLKTDDTTIVAPITGYIGFRTTSSFTEAQCEIGYTSTSYVAHQEQSTTLHLGSLYLGGIRENRDYIDPYTKKKIGVIDYIVLDGSEDEEWQQISGTFRISKEDLGMELDADSLNIKSNQYIFQVETPTDIGQARVGESRLIFKFDDGTTSVEDFRTWLSNNNLIIYWVLNRPFESTITDTTLLTELEVLNNMRSYDGTTNITATSEDTNAQMEVEVTYTSESDMNEKLTNIFNLIKSKLYHIIRAL